MNESNLIPCTCNWLQRGANHENCPIEFDEELNEYAMVRGGHRWCIRFCPGCGGAAPESKRDSLFKVLTETELNRVYSLLETVKTLDDLLAKFGPPEDDFGAGSVRLWKETDKHSTISQQFRQLRYENLSETATVYVDVHPSGLVEFGISAKPLDDDGQQPSSA